MLCSVCFKETTQFIQLPCSHVLCHSCIPKKSFHKDTFRYQCQTCFAFHQIPLNEDNIKIDDDFQQYSMNSFYGSKKQNCSQFVFCWHCQQALLIKDYLKNRKHHDHKVNTFDEALPKIKDVLTEQLQKSSSIKYQLHQAKKNLESNLLQKSYNQLIDKINAFFTEQFEILQNKHQTLMQELKTVYEHTLNEAQGKIQNLTLIIKNLQQMENKMTKFINNQSTIMEINPLREVINIMDEFQQFSTQKRNFELPELPRFVVKQSLQKHVNQCSELLSNSKLQNENEKISIFRNTNKELRSVSKNSIKPQSRTATINNFKDTKTPPNQDQHIVERKVRLVQKLKDKIKYSSSMCSTGFM